MLEFILKPCHLMILFMASHFNREQQQIIESLQGIVFKRDAEIAELRKHHKPGEYAMSKEIPLVPDWKCVVPLHLQSVYRDECSWDHYLMVETEFLRMADQADKLNQLLKTLKEKGIDPEHLLEPKNG